jgi:hypothetical protein
MGFIDGNHMFDMKLSDLRDRAREALSEYENTVCEFRVTLMRIDSDELSPYAKLRIEALIAEANAVGNIPIIDIQDNIEDYMWIEKCCQRKTLWIKSIVRKCQILCLYDELSK